MGGYANNGNLPFTGGSDTFLLLVVGAVILLAGIVLWRTAR